MIDLRLGDYRETMQDVEPDVVICDPPYSMRVEKGFRSGTKGQKTSPGMGYDPIDKSWICAFVDFWHRKTKGWIVVCSDHESAIDWASALTAKGRYVFAPVVIAKTGYAPRMSCDGPASGCEYITVARPKRKEFMSWGSLPGWHRMQTVRSGHGHIGVSGAKSVDLMRAIIRDYSRPGDLICDPCAGGGTTLLAAEIEGRRAVGSEIDPDTHAKATKRLAAGFTPGLFG